MHEADCYRQLFYNAPMACVYHEVLFDKNGDHAGYRFVEVNEAFEKLAGFSREKLVGATASEVFQESDNNGRVWRSMYDRIAAKKGIPGFELSFGESERLYMVNAYAPDASHMTIVMTDLKSGMPSPSRGSAKDWQQQAFWDNDLFGVMIFDKQGNIVDVNDEACRMTCYSREELAERGLSDLIVPEQVAEMRNHIELVDKYGRATGEVAYYTRNAEKRWWNVVSTPLPNGQILAFHEDITGRKQAEEAMRLREERLERQNNALLALMSGGIMFQSDLQQAIAEITELSSTLVETERVSVWTYNDDFTELQCINLFSGSGHQHLSQKESLRCEEFPTYFASQKRGEVIAASDVFTDPRTRELPASYYKEHNIRSMLDTPVWFHNRLGAVLCFEHTGNERLWTTEDVRLATSMATLLSLCFQNDNRRRTEETLRQNRNMLDTILNTIPQSVFWKDKDCRYLGCNAQFAKAAGVQNPENITGKTDFNLAIPAEKAAAYVKDDLFVLESRTSKNHIVELIPHADGTRQWIDTTKIPLLDQDGSVYGVLGVYEDITQHKLIEENLVQEHLRFQHLFEHSPIATWLEDFTELIQWFDELRHQGVDDLRLYFQQHPDQLVLAFSMIKIKDVNQAALEQNAASSKEELLENTTQLFESDTLTDFILELEMIWKGEEQFEYESHGRKLNGQPLDVIVRLMIPKQEGRLDYSRVVVTGTDITERKRAEAEKESALMLLQSALSQSPSGILIADAPDVRIMWVNEAAFTIRGKSDRPLTGIELEQHSVSWQTYRLDGTPMPPEELPLSRAILRGEIVRNEEVIIRHTSGEDHYVSANAAPVRNAAGEIKAGIVVFHDITEIKRAAEELKASERKYQELSTLLRLMADNMPDLLWAKNLDKEFIFTNKAICNILLNASDTSEPLGKTDMFFAMRERNSRPEQPGWFTFGEICSDSDSLTLEAMKPMQFDEYGHVRGKFLFLDVHKAPLFDDKGQLIGVVGSARDVTAAREAENQLRKLSQAVEQSPASVMITNPGGTIEYVNPKFTKVSGYTSEEAVGQNPRILKSGALPDELYCDLWKTISSGREWKGEFLNRKKGGELFWESVSISPIRNSNGETLHYLAVKEDITERKALEASLEHQTRLRELLMEISSGFINIPLGKVNETIQDALGKMALFVDADRAYTFDYDWGNQVCHNTYEWCAQEVQPEIENLQNLPLHFMQEWVDAHKTGESKFVYDVAGLPSGIGKDTLEKQGIKSFLTVPMMNEGHCIGFVGFDWVREHHVYSEPEVQMLRLFAQLLANVKLRKEMVGLLVSAKTKAEESNLLKTHFINNISHEIRTPLNGIIGFGDMIMDENLSPEEKQYYHHILKQSSNRLMQTITDIMDIAELKSDSLGKNRENLDIGLALTRLTDEIRFACSQKNIVVSQDFQSKNEQCIISTDAELFRKVVRHLLNNAVKFTTSGRITVGFTEHEDHVELFVKDTGKGISADKLETIFEPFMQEDVRNTRGHEGNGLGLAIARGIVTLLGGEIRVESIKGEGSAFYFTVPRNEAQITSHAPEASPAANELSGNRVVLIAEDDESSAQLIQVIVQKAGFQTLHAWNGQEAVDLCMRYPEVTVVLMDIKMPLMNGLEATERIKKFRPSLPVIALTAYAQSGDRNRILEAGCDDYLAKPLTKSMVLDTLSEFMR